MSNVDHPSHYNLPGKKECIEQMKEDYGDFITAVFCLTNAYKYLYRAGHKNDRQEDINKATWYFEYQNNLDYDIWENDAVRKLRDYIETELIYGDRS